MEILKENQRAVDYLNESFCKSQAHQTFQEFKRDSLAQGIDLSFLHSFPMVLSKDWKNTFEDLSQKLSLSLNSFHTENAPIPTQVKAHLQRIDMPAPIIRVDCSMDRTKHSLKIVEVNCSDPSAFGFHDWTLSWVHQRGLLENDPQYISDHMLSYFTNEHQKRFGKDPQSYLLAMEANSSVSWDFHAYLRWMQLKGHKCLLAEPCQIDYASGRLSVNGESFDVLVRDSIEEIIPKNNSKELPLWKALIDKDRKFILSNPLESLIADDKTALAWLSQNEELQILPTFILSPHKKDNLFISPAQLKEDKNSWVLKPSSGYGGQGVVIGNFVSQAEWESSLDALLQTDQCYVAQRYIESKCQIKALENYYENISFWIVGHRFAGAFVRLSIRPIVNVHNGATISPVIFRDHS